MALLIKLASLLSFCVFIAAEEFSCLDIKPVHDFQLEKAEGLWYTIARKSNEYDVVLKCVKYTLEPYTNDAILITLTGIIIGKNNGTILYDAVFEFKDDHTVGDFNVHVKEKDPKRVIDLKLVAIDYDNFLIWYGCSLAKQFDYCWIAVREREVSNEMRDKIISEASKLGIDKYSLVKLDQTDCNN